MEESARLKREELDSMLIASQKIKEAMELSGDSLFNKIIYWLKNKFK
jgi:hypothetical protein